MTKCKLYANGQPGQVPGGSVGKHEKARIPFADAWNVTLGNSRTDYRQLRSRILRMAEQICSATTVFAKLAAATFVRWNECKKFAVAKSANWNMCTPSIASLAFLAGQGSYGGTLTSWGDGQSNDVWEMIGQQLSTMLGVWHILFSFRNVQGLSIAPA